MLSFPTVATFLALFASVSALPTSTSSPAEVEAREYLNCPVGYWYSKCGTFDGCFNYDPCSGQTSPPPPPPAGCTKGRVIAPQFIDLQVRFPDANMTSTSGNLMALFRDDSLSHRMQDQVAQFRGIPKEAKTCSIGWRQKAAPRTFGVVDGNGSVSFQVLASLPSPVTYNAVKALVPAGVGERTMDFTFWDQSERAEEHGGGSIDCSENIYVYLTLAKAVKQGGVFMQGVGSDQAALEGQQGLFIDYTC